MAFSKRPKIGFQYQLSLNAGQKYCRILQGEHFAILLTFIKVPFVIKIFILSIFEWPFYTGFTVLQPFLTHLSTLEHSAILLTFIKLPFVIKIFVLRSLFCLFLSGCFTQVLLYMQAADAQMSLHICVLSSVS